MGGPRERAPPDCRCGRTGLVTWAGRCHPLREPLPFGPVVDALREARPPDGARLSPATAVLAPYLPELVGRLPAGAEAGGVGDLRQRLMRAVHDLLTVLGPVVPAVEDVHRADDATRELLLLLARNPPPRLRLLLTYRAQDLPERRNVLGAPHRRQVGVGGADAARLLDEARAGSEACGRVYRTARTAEQAGRTLIADNPDEAGRLLQHALDVFTHLDATSDAAHCQQSLRECGHRPAAPRGRRGYGPELSLREQQVAQLLATGATNQDIARALALSTRTAEHHVADTLKKLGVTRDRVVDILGPLRQHHIRPAREPASRGCRQSDAHPGSRDATPRGPGRGRRQAEGGPPSPCAGSAR